MFSRNKAKILLGLAATTNALLDNYWLFTDVPLDSDHENEIVAKVFYTFGQVLSVLALWGYGVGKLLDDQRATRNDLYLNGGSESGNFSLSRASFFNTHKAQIVTAGLGITKALMDNYWLFTQIPLAGDLLSDPLTKTLLITGECTVNAILWGAVGKIIDDHRAQQLSFDDIAQENSLFGSVRRGHYGSVWS